MKAWRTRLQMEAERLRGLFFDVLQETRVQEYPAMRSSSQTFPSEERSIDVLCRTSRAMYGFGNDVGVSPVMMEMLRGYMRSCGHSDARSLELCQVANRRLSDHRKVLRYRERNPRRRQNSL